MTHTEPRIRIVRSLAGLRALTAISFIVILMVFGTWREPSGVGSREESRFFTGQTGEWRKTYGESPDLRVAAVTIQYAKDVGRFRPREGVLLAPVALHMPGVQEVLDTAAYPAALRQLEVDGIRCLTWEYAGRINREIGADALTLVRTMPQPPEMPEAGMPWTFDTLPEEIRFDALSKVKDTQEHDLHECNAFKDWVVETAGEDDDPFVRLMNIVTDATGRMATGDDDSCYNLCKSLRKNSLDLHAVHVVTVMAIREIGIPCFGFCGIDPGQTYLVGVFSDRTGWKFFNLGAPRVGFMAETPVLLTRVPIIGEFEGTWHDFWAPGAVVVTQGNHGSLRCYNASAWQTHNSRRGGMMTGISWKLAEWL